MKPANAFFERTAAGVTRQHTFARFEQRPTGYVLRLRGWHFGRFCAIGYEGSDQHYISGDLVYETPISDDGERLTQICGAVWTDCSPTGNAAYNGVLFCNPFPLVMMRRHTEDSLSRWGIVLKVVSDSGTNEGGGEIAWVEITNGEWK